jgi:hypothetical protein
MGLLQLAESEQKFVLGESSVLALILCYSLSLSSHIAHSSRIQNISTGSQTGANTIIHDQSDKTTSFAKTSARQKPGHISHKTRPLTDRLCCSGDRAGNPSNRSYTFSATELLLTNLTPGMSAYESRKTLQAFASSIGTAEIWRFQPKPRLL